MKRLAAAMLALVMLCSTSAADKKKPAFYLKPGQKAEIAGFTAVTAEQKCPNWAWAAGIETLLRGLDVSLPQKFWIYKAHTGEICVPLGNWESLARLIPGEYQLDDGRKVRLETRYTEGASIAPDDLIAALRRGQSIMVAWRGTVYLLHGAVFDEYISLTGVRRFDVRELYFTNPLVSEGEGRVVSFVKERDDISEIQGTLEISATFIKPPDWLRKQ